jgi:hypothetical protein
MGKNLLRGRVGWGRFLLALGLATQLMNWQTCAASTYALTEGNSTVNFDSGTGALNGWAVDGQNQLNVQSFWYRIGSGNVTALGAATVNPVSDNQLEASWTIGSQLYVKVTYYLIGTGPGDGEADIMQGITVKNLSGSASDIHLYQYTDFNLAGTPTGDAGFMSQDFGKFTSATQYKGLLNATVAYSAPAPPADWAEVLGAGGGGLLSVAGTSQDLSGNVGSFLSPVTGADVSWAMQWDFYGLGANRSKLISEDLHIEGVLVPEPSTLGLAGVGLVLAVLRRRSR